MTNIERSENHKDICKFENCDRIANYRRLKVGNCHLKIHNTNFVHIIDQRTVLIKNSLTRQFLINKEYQ